MFADTVARLVALLYYLCFVLIAGLIVVIAVMGRRNVGSQSQLRRTFYLALGVAAILAIDAVPGDKEQNPLCLNSGLAASTSPR